MGSYSPLLHLKGQGWGLVTGFSNIDYLLTGNQQQSSGGLVTSFSIIDYLYTGNQQLKCKNGFERKYTSWLYPDKITILRLVCYLKRFDKIPISSPVPITDDKWHT